MIFNEIIYLFIFLFGLAIGSFLNCLIYRIKINKAPTGSSFCPNCKHDLVVNDLIPLFSYLFLKGKCRYCGEKISIQYPLVEFFTGLIFLFTAYSLGIPSNVMDLIVLVLTLITFSLLIIVFVYDLKHFIIPNKIIYPAIGIAVTLAIFKSIINQDINLIINYFSAGLIFFAIFLSIYLLTKKKGIGFGDVRYAGFLGLFLGFKGGLIALFFSFIIGAIIGVVLIASKVKGRKDMIPFGPFLVVGTFIGFFFTEIIIDFYFNLLL